MLQRSLLLALILGFAAMPFMAFAQVLDPLSDKIAVLQATAMAHNGIIQLDSDSFDNMLSKPRNYSVVVLFTAMSPEFKCIPCKNFDPEFKLVASSWSKIPDRKRLFFGIVDFKDGQRIFQKFGMVSAPSLLYFPTADSNQELPDFDRFDFNSRGLRAESFASWLSSKSGILLDIKRPFDFTTFASKIIRLLGFCIIGRALYSRAGSVLRSKQLWSSLSLITILFMISGHMMHHINKRPSSRNDGAGFFSIFQDGFALESLVVGVAYAVLAGSVISLISSVPSIEDPSKQRFIVLMWLCIFGVMFGNLLQVVRLNHPAYPFSFIL